MRPQVAAWGMPWAGGARVGWEGVWIDVDPCGLWLCPQLAERDLQRVTGPLRLSPHLVALSYLPQIVTTVTRTSVSLLTQTCAWPVLGTFPM